MKYQVVLDARVKTGLLVQVIGAAAGIPANFTKIGEFDHVGSDLFGPEVSHVVFQHVQELMYKQGYLDMGIVHITWPGKVVGTAVAVAAFGPVIAGTETQLTATTTPVSVSRPRLRWTTRDDKVAFINSRGLLIARQPGVTKGRVSLVDGGAYSEFTIDVKVKGYVAPTSIAVTPAGTSTLTVAAPTVQLAVAFTPAGATDKRVTYSSSDVTKATVSKTGLVTRVANGTAVITVTTVDGAKTATKAITTTA